MTHPSPEAVERALTYFAGKPKSFTGMLATLHGKTLAAHVAALTTQLEAERCDGCGSTMTDAELTERRKTDPKLIACCPERRMVSGPAYRQQITTLEASLTREKERADAAEAEAKDAMLANAALREALKEVLSWHDYTDDMHKPVEVRAAYMRARATLAQPAADGGDNG